MSVVKVKCPVCRSENVSKNGISKVGKQQTIVFLPFITISAVSF